MKSRIKNSISKSFNKSDGKSNKTDKLSLPKSKHKFSHHLISYKKLKIKEQFIIFGGKIEDAISTSFQTGLLVPIFFNEWISYIEANGTNIEKVYDTCSSKKEIKSLIFLYNNHEKINLSDYDCVLVANILKLYLSALDGGLFEKHHNDLEFIAKKERITRNEILYLLYQLPTPNYSMFGSLIRHIRIMAEHEEGIKMSLDDLVDVFADILSLNKEILKMILEDDEIFPGKHFIRIFSRVGDENSNELILSELALRGEINFHESTINFLSKTSMDSGVELLRHKYSLSYLKNELENCLSFIPEESKLFSNNSEGIISEELNEELKNKIDINSDNKLSLESEFLSDNEEEPDKDIEPNEKIKLFLKSELNKISEKIEELIPSDSKLSNEKLTELKALDENFERDSHLLTENRILKEINMWLIEKIGDVINENATLKNYIEVGRLNSIEIQKDYLN